MGSMVSSLVFQPPPTTFLHEKKHFWLQTRNHNRIPVFHVDRSSQFTVLFSHGNAEGIYFLYDTPFLVYRHLRVHPCLDLGLIYEWFYDFSRQLNVNVLAYEYAGYGKSEGSQSEDNCYADIRAAYDYLTQQKSISSKQIILYGRSLGSGPTCQLAEELAGENIQLGGVILQSPLASAFRVAFDFRYTLPGDLFPNIDRMPNIRCPVFIIHGTRDEVVPFWHGERLFFATPTKWRAKPFWVDGAGHNNIEVLLREDGTLFDRMTDFLDEWCRNDFSGDAKTPV